MKLVNTPRQLLMSLYDETRKIVREKYSQIPQVKEIVEFGTIPLPGISDMDFIAVVEPGVKIQGPGLNTYTEDQRFAMSHRHYAQSSRVHPFHRYLDPWLVHCTPVIHPETTEYGMNAIQKLSEEEHQWLSFRRMIHWTLLTFLPSITTVKLKKTISCRSFFDTSITIKYIYRELAKFGIADANSDPHIQQYVALRDDWWNLSESDQENRMTKAFDAFCESTKNLVSVLSQFLETKTVDMKVKQEWKPSKVTEKQLLKKYPNSCILDTCATTFVFQKDKTDIDVTVGMYRSPLTRRYCNDLIKSVYVLPLPLISLYNNFLLGNGLVSNQYTTSFSTDLSEIPRINQPSLTKFVELADMNEEDMQFVTGLKSLFDTFGLQRKPNGIGERFSVAHYNFLTSVSLLPFGRILRSKQLQYTL